jgi:hypothetical protein
LSNKIVEKWLGKTVNDYNMANLTFGETMAVVEDIWKARENGENVNAETEAASDSWFNNYKK